MSTRVTLQRLAFRLLRLHDTLYQKTNGRIGHKIPGVPPSLLLHTVGAKTGQPRTNSLTYARDGESYLIVASNAGAKRYPGWYHNLRKHPDCEINVGPKRLAVRARRITPEDSDYPRLWRVVNENNSDRYSNYQRKTSRPIPIFAMTPR
ncbi:nitroreductase family deazaflavin-dependent oxidoreductase [Mycobacterium sp. 1423905.2]|jgi:deazaflavin-dependent oxidoreductase (nitroreductase family)|uniref:nitroreductase family deazaflavin-dependent oxidoreductase n=1 Tax=Mycobacterium sp. 1423905.2 TaxID=1856859 RepID=UPI0007FC9C0A|nr:nitroreductase family deazaflavin-dependent oxidoreductase [Mycobacterium sp. 1423905.2]OBJ49375.1 nitroreductase [Mycobacterium sp. 1423905.2]